MIDAKGWNDLAAVQNQLGEKNNLLIVDGNNLAYRWIQRRNYNHFEEDYVRTIESLGNSYKAERIIVCFDFGKSYYLMNISDDYKTKADQKCLYPGEFNRITFPVGSVNSTPEPSET